VIGVTVGAHSDHDTVEIESDKGVALVQSWGGASEKQSRPVTRLNLLVWVFHPATELLFEGPFDEKMKQVEVPDAPGESRNPSPRAQPSFGLTLASMNAPGISQRTGLLVAGNAVGQGTGKPSRSAAAWQSATSISVVDTNGYSAAVE
jgi:hypothetical protein